MEWEEATMRCLIWLVAGSLAWGTLANASESWTADVSVDLVGGWVATTHREARVHVALELLVSEGSVGGFTFALPDVACGLGDDLIRTCAPVAVVEARASGCITPFHAGSGLLKVKLPELVQPGDNVSLDLFYTFPAFRRGAGVVGLGGSSGWLPQGDRPLGDVTLRVATLAEERTVASGARVEVQDQGATQVSIWRDVDDARPAILVGPFGPTAPLVDGVADMTLTRRTALEPELEELARETLLAHVLLAGPPRRPLQLVVAPYVRGDAGAPLVGAAGAFGTDVILLHSPFPAPAFDVQRPDRIFPIPSREVRSTREVLESALRSSSRHRVGVSSDSRDAWIGGFLSEALDDRPQFADPWSAPAGLLRRDHGALWPGDTVPGPPDLRGLGAYLAHLVRLRMGDEAFAASLARAIQAAADEDLTTDRFLDAWHDDAAEPSLMTTLGDVLSVQRRAFVEVTWSSRKVGDEAQGGGHDAEIQLTVHGGYDGPEAVHLALLTTTGEVRQLWTLADGGASHLEVEGLPAQLAEVFVVRDGLAVGIASADVVPH